MKAERRRKIRSSARQIKAAANDLLERKLPMPAVLEAVTDLQHEIAVIAHQAYDQYLDELAERILTETDAAQIDEDEV